MFTANSMNCLAEAMGLGLPGNGSTLATHADREGLFRRAGQRIVELAKIYYEDGDKSVSARGIATKAAFENAMTLDIAMGGSTNTILHLLAIAREGEVDFTLDDIDRLSRSTPCRSCRVAMRFFGWMSSSSSSTTAWTVGRAPASDMPNGTSSVMREGAIQP